MTWKIEIHRAVFGATHTHAVEADERGAIRVLCDNVRIGQLSASAVVEGPPTCPKCARGVKEATLRHAVEGVVGPLELWQICEAHAPSGLPASVRFRAKRSLTLTDVTALAAACGTYAINFDFGDGGEPGYSDVTPSSPGSAGYIEVMVAL